jgi:hypothetical protein
MEGTQVHSALCFSRKNEMRFSEKNLPAGMYLFLPLGVSCRGCLISMVLTGIEIFKTGFTRFTGYSAAKPPHLSYKSCESCQKMDSLSTTLI